MERDKDDAFCERWKLAYEKTLRMKLLCRKIKSHMCLEIFQSTNDTNRRGHSVLELLGHCYSLDTVIANITAVSLNFWQIKLVKEQSLVFLQW